ncbi:MAG TPA: hypothetical protein PKJ33_03085 [Alphaproteobacteria bacterium]|nr:hypothetical protein [Alphaproteobacteria bacterium]
MKYGGIKDIAEEQSWQSLLDNANNDFINILLLWYCGINMQSTYIWMFAHSIEKYLKSFLSKPSPFTNKPLMSDKELIKISENGHSIKDLWKKYKEFTSNSTLTKPELNKAFDDIIEDISSIKIGVRYSYASGYSSDTFLYFYVVLCSFLRYRIIGKQKYRSSLYGLDDIQHFYPMNYNPMSEGYGKIIITKMLHIILEHAGCFTNMGSVNSVDFEKLSISNTAMFGKLKDCPICNKEPIDHEKLIRFYRDIKPIEPQKYKANFENRLMSNDG